MKKKILFRADGNSSIGLGHLYRLFSLVEMLKEDFEGIYITRSSSTLSVIPEEYSTVTIPEDISIDKEPDWFANQYDNNKYIIIADGYQFDSIYQKKIKEKGFSLVFIDDLAEEYMYADLVINHSPGLKVSDFKSEDYTRFALGTKFGLLRPVFLETAKHIREITHIDSAFVCFGGADKFNLSLKSVQALLRTDQIKQINVVLGAAYQDKELYELEKQFPQRLHIYKNLSEIELNELMLSCNFAIAPASTICYELCCVKMPILGGYFVDNQELIYKGFLEGNAIFGGGNFENYNSNDFEKKIKTVLDIKEYTGYINSQQKLFDSGIKARIVEIIKNIC